LRFRADLLGDPIHKGAVAELADYERDALGLCLAA
jgi:hypothetical protein